MRNNRLLYMIVVGGITVLDQITKFIVRYHFSQDDIVRIFNNDLVWFVFVLNPGFAFGLRILPSVILTIIALVVAVGLGIFLYRNPFMQYRQGIPIAFIMGGAIGNMIDRLIYGEVTDFISVDMPDFIMHRWPVFNVADSAVSIGVISLVVFSFFSGKQKTAAKSDGLE